MNDITRENFNISESSWDDFKKYFSKMKHLIKNVLDYHFEKTEEAMFNWIHSNTTETPIEIKNALMPHSMVNVLHVKEGWFFWYI